MMRRLLVAACAALFFLPIFRDVDLPGKRHAVVKPKTRQMLLAVTIPFTLTFPCPGGCSGGGVCDSCAENLIRIDQCQGPSGCGDGCSGEGTNDCGGTFDNCCAGALYFSQTISPPSPGVPWVCIIEAVGDDFFDDDIALNGVPLGSCSAGWQGRICIQMDADESLTIAAVNNIDNCVQVHCNVYRCVGTDSSAQAP